VAIWITTNVLLPTGSNEDASKLCESSGTGDLEVTIRQTHFVFSNGRIFMHTMLIRPDKEKLKSFGTPDFVICNAGAFPANRLTSLFG
jgi:ATP-dependent phosphoenolpyruvate carboxykinase